MLGYVWWRCVQARQVTRLYPMRYGFPTSSLGPLEARGLERGDNLRRGDHGRETMPLAVGIVKD